MAVPDKDKDNGKKGKRVITQAMRDKSKAKQRAAMLASPYDKAAKDIQAELNTYKTPEEIRAETAARYTDATAQSATSEANTVANYTNTGNVFAGLMGGFEGADSSNFTEQMGLGRASVAQAADTRDLMIKFSQQEAGNRDVASSRAEQRDLNSQRRNLTLQRDVAGADWQTQLNNILTTRSARMDIASKNLSLKQQRDALARSRGGSGGGTQTKTVDTTGTVDPIGGFQSAQNMNNMIGGTSAQRAAANAAASKAVAKNTWMSQFDTPVSPGVSYQPITDMINSSSRPKPPGRFGGQTYNG